jgi:hypothetical protein
MLNELALLSRRESTSALIHSSQCRSPDLA